MTEAGGVIFPEAFSLADYFLFDRLREGLGEKTAIRYGARAWTYAEVAARSLGLSRYLRHRGIEPEQRVYIVLPDAPAFAWAFFGVLANGSVVTMGNPAAPVDDLAYVIDYVRATVLITLPEVARNLAPVIAASDTLRIVLLVPDTATGGDPEGDCEPLAVPGRCEFAALREAIAAGGALHVPRRAIRRDDPAIWLFTSGSTGRPKAAVHTQRDFAFNTEVYARRTVGYRADDVTVSVPGLFFGYATGTNLMFPFAVGATTCLFSERPTPDVLADAVERYRPTVVTNVPTMMAKLLDYDDERSRIGAKPLDFSSVRFHLSAGEALPPPLLERFRARFENDVYDGIGSAEMFHIYASNRPGDIKPGSLGRAVEGYTLRILATDAETPGERALPPGKPACYGCAATALRSSTTETGTGAGRRSTGTGAARAISFVWTKTVTCGSRGAPTASSRWVGCSWRRWRSRNAS